jgi:hypothetical protein
VAGDDQYGTGCIYSACRGVFTSATLTLHLFAFPSGTRKIVPSPLHLWFSCPHRTGTNTMSFFKKLKSEFEEMFGDDDKKKEEKPSQPLQDAKPTESSRFLVLRCAQTYSS